MRTKQWNLRSYVEGQTRPTPSDFEFVEADVGEVGEGELLVRTIYLSMDPYMRGRISPTKNYTEGVKPGQVMTGRAVAQVIKSRAPHFADGDFVMGETGWREKAVVKAASMLKIDPTLAPISTAVGLLGMPGLSGYFALLDLGRPRAGDTVVVTAASGAVGSTAGQIARLSGCRTIAIVGSDQKVAYCRDELGYDAAINYKTSKDLSAEVSAAAPRGVDVFFDNSGGTVHQAVIPHLAIRARVIICGVMSQYNPIEASKPTTYNMRHILVPRAEMTGFLIYDFAHRSNEGLIRLGQWYREGKLKFRETIAQGLEQAPNAFISMLNGENLGKQLVQVGPDPTR
jgi:NADPH-dependent curcumin reductase CurA